MADEGAGASLAFGSSGTSLDVLNIQSQGIEREALDVTHHGTAGGYKEFIPADFTDPGTVQVTFLYDPNTQPPHTAAAETITITYPNGATEFFSGFITGFDPPALEIDSVMEASITIKKSGAITFTTST